MQCRRLAAPVALATMLTACGCMGRAPAPALPADLVYVRPEVLAFLATAQRDLTTEEVACLVGAQVGRTIVVDGIRPAVVWAATERSARYTGCHGTLGTWHNHPRVNYDACRFSEPDTWSFLRSDALIDLLSCGEGEFRLRTRERPDTMYVIRPEGQR